MFGRSREVKIAKEKCLMLAESRYCKLHISFMHTHEKHTVSLFRAVAKWWAGWAMAHSVFRRF